MKPGRPGGALVALALVPAWALAQPCATDASRITLPPRAVAVSPGRLEDSLRVDRFGTVTIYRPDAPPSWAVLFISGDGGWNLGVVEMARDLSRAGALVVGVDIRHYLASFNRATGECEYAAADFERLSQYVQQSLVQTTYLPPVLVGYSSGATLAYAVLAQAPAGTFRGAISLGFCPDLPMPRPLCREGGLRWTTEGSREGYRFEPLTERDLPWFVLQGTVDRVCAPDTARAFVRAVPGAELISLPEVGHGFGVTRRWLPQLTDALARLAAQDSSSHPPLDAPIRDLPLVALPSHRPTDRPELAVILSGDGGWVGLDRQVARVLVDSGIPVVGWSSLDYFWRPRTPEVLAADLARVIRHYAAAWHKTRIVLVGYSRGADVLPFAANRLPPDLHDRVTLIALLAPEDHAGFHFRPTDLIRDTRRAGDRPLRPELERLGATPLLCFYGDEETDTACTALPAGVGTAIRLTGGHHLGGGYADIGARIVRESAHP